MRRGPYQGGLLTRARLGAARMVLWTGWHLAIVGAVAFLRREHPFRVYIVGARHTVLRVQLDALRHATDRRFGRGGRGRPTRMRSLKLGLAAWPVLVATLGLLPCWVLLDVI